MSERKVRKLFYVVLLVLLSSTTLFGQKGWNVLRKSNSGDLNSVFFLNSDKGWIGGDNGYLGFSSDGGKSWTKQTINTTANIVDIFFRGNDVGFVLTTKSVFSTGDGGIIWREIKPYTSGQFGKLVPELNSFRFVGKKKGWIVGSLGDDENILDSLLLVTEDSGQTWRRMILPTKEEVVHLDFIDENRGWAVGALGMVLKTDDGGKTWKSQSSKITDKLFHVDFRDGNRGWAVGEKGIILSTQNGGQTWEKTNSGVNKTLTSVEFLNDKTGFIIGRGGIIMRSDDNGKSWLKQDSKVIDPLFSLLVRKDGVWSVGGKGQVLRFFEK